MKSEPIRMFSVGLWRAVAVANEHARHTAPLASIVVVNYNGKRDLERCLPSLVADSSDYEVIVVDNLSTDGSAEYVEHLFPEVRVIRNPKNGGYGQGNNLGASCARGKYLAFLNPDTVVTPGWLGELIDVLEADPDAGMATSQIRLLDRPDLLNTAGNEVHCTGLAMCRGMGCDASHPTWAQPSEVSAVSGAAFAIRKDLFEQLGGFDETFFMYVEDTDLSWRARLNGRKILYVPSSVVHHDYELTFGPNKTYYQERNRYLMLLKNLRWGTMFVLAPAFFLAEVVTWAFVLLRDRSRLANKFRGYGWIIAHWPEIMESRRRTQVLRRAADRDVLAPSACRLAYELTGDGLPVQVARAVVDPLFCFLRRVALQIVGW